MSSKGGFESEAVSLLYVNEKGRSSLALEYLHPYFRFRSDRLGKRTRMSNSKKGSVSSSNKKEMENANGMFEVICGTPVYHNLLDRCLGLCLWVFPGSF